MITTRELPALSISILTHCRHKLLRWLPKTFEISGDNCYATWQT